LAFERFSTLTGTLLSGNRRALARVISKMERESPEPQPFGDLRVLQQALEGPGPSVRGYERQVYAIIHHRLCPMACNVHSVAMPPPRVNKTLLVRQAIRAATSPASNRSLPNETSKAPFA